MIHDSMTLLNISIFHVSIMMRSVSFILAWNLPYLTRSCLVPRYQIRYITPLLPFARRKPRLVISRSINLSQCNNQDVDIHVTHTFSTQPNHLGAILHTSFQILQYYQAPEPMLSACHIVAFVLQDNNQEMPSVRWEDNYFAHLLNILERAYSTSNINQLSTHLDLDSLLRVPIPHSLATDDTLSRTLTTIQRNHLISMIIRRIQKEPLQYIFGKWDFYDFTLLVRKPCLCPRPETEELVYLTSLDIRAMIQKNPMKRTIRILDVGAGTGAIGIALARMFPSHVQVVAIDIKEAAVQLSRDNAHLLLSHATKMTKEMINSSNYTHNILDPLHQTIRCSAAQFTNKCLEPPNPPYDFRFDIVVSNPPYIPLTDMSTLSDDVVMFEDRDALCGGADGMDVIRTILQRLEEWWACESVVFDCDPLCWMEVDPIHPSIIRTMVEESQGPIRFVETRQDLNGRNRYVKLSLRRYKKS